MTTTRSKGIFSGVRVIELAGVLAGPAVGMFLAEQGAEVIKVEPPSGDVTRSWKLSEEDTDEDRPAYFCAVNWGKKSIALDLKQALGRKALSQLIDTADIVLTSFLPGSAKRLGLEAGDWLRKKPELIWGTISGYGPKSERPAYDAIIQAEAGFTYLNGEPDQISKMPVALMDILAAHQLKEGILLAWIDRLRTGKGRVINVSLIESALASLANQATNWLVAGVIPQPTGSEHPNIAPYGTIFTCREGGDLVLAVGNDTQFAALCQVLGLGQLPRFSTNQQRVRLRKQLNTLLAQAIGTWKREELLTQLLQERVPAGAVNDMPSAMQNAKALLLKGGEKKGLRNFVAQGFDPFCKLSPPPKLSGQAREILTDLGIAELELSQMVKAKVVRLK